MSTVKNDGEGSPNTKVRSVGTTDATDATTPVSTAGAKAGAESHAVGTKDAVVKTTDAKTTSKSHANAQAEAGANTGTRADVRASHSKHAKGGGAGKSTSASAAPSGASAVTAAPSGTPAAASAPATAPKVIKSDPWRDSYAARADNMRASEIRALFSVASRPDVVSLAGGMPYLEYMPFDELSELIAKMMRDKGDVAWQYGSAQGDPHLREDVLQIMALEGIKDVQPDDVVISNGSQNAIDLVTRIMCDPGDVVIAEAPNYVGALGVFQSFQVEVVNATTDENGLIPESFEQTIVAARKAGKKVKFLYTVPNFHNPAGVTMSVERRPKILEIARRHHVLVLEDNPYGLLGFDGQTYPALRSMDAENVVYMSSFSKIIAPGMRIAWMVAPPGIRKKLILANEASILCPPNMSQMTITTYLDNFDWKSQISQYRGMYKERCDTMDAALREYLPYCSWNKPKGGFYIWLKIPEGLNSKEMLPRAITAKVAYVAGTGFYLDGSGTHHMRLSFCYPTPENIRIGIERLAGVMNNELETARLFGTSSAEQVEQQRKRE